MYFLLSLRIRIPERRRIQLLTTLLGLFLVAFFSVEIVMVKECVTEITLFHVSCLRTDRPVTLVRCLGLTVCTVHWQLL